MENDWELENWRTSWCLSFSWNRYKICLHKTTKSQSQEKCAKKIASVGKKVSLALFNFSQGGSYNVFIKIDAEDDIEPTVEVVLPPNDLNVLWQLPQYILLTVGEVMFSIPSLQFAYTQVSSYCAIFWNTVQKKPDAQTIKRDPIINLLTRWRKLL